ncbi:MAG: hypothetical protein ACI9UJ_001995, partial [bacterium]
MYRFVNLLIIIIKEQFNFSMKRAILLAAVMSTMIVAYGQSTSDLHQPSADQLIQKGQLDAIDGFRFDATPTAETATPTSHGKYRSEVYDFVRIGNTYYDLQTNGSIGRRAILHSDGTVTGAWTFSSTSSTTWPDRGSAVNYYDGTSWGAEPTVRTEGSDGNSIRSGWPSIGEFSDGSMYTIAHDAANGGLIIARNTGKGQTTWNPDASTVFNHAGGNMIWN